MLLSDDQQLDEFDIAGRSLLDAVETLFAKRARASRLSGGGEIRSVEHDANDRAREARLIADLAAVTSG